MPSSTSRQQRFFGAVMGAKHGKTGVSGKAKEVASHMSKDQIQHYLKRASASEAYALGFMVACGDLGIDSETLIKLSEGDADIAAGKIVPSVFPGVHKQLLEQDKKLKPAVTNAPAATNAPAKK